VDKLVVLSIGAHPDDIEIGSGGSLGIHKNNGDEIYGLLCSLGGVRGDPKEREEEARNAANLLGLHLHMLDYPVQKLNKPTNEFTKILRKYIEEINPDRIYTHSPFDYHQVHTTVSKSVSIASAKIAQLLFYETISSTTPDFKPDAFVDITSMLDLKIKSIEAHKSQMEDRFYIQPNVIRSLANTRYVWGKVGNDPNGFAEAFVTSRFVV
jgi:LmbE family N-acetylglucosaminyl deacetylase